MEISLFGAWTNSLRQIGKEKKSQNFFLGTNRLKKMNAHEFWPSKNINKSKNKSNIIKISQKINVYFCNNLSARTKNVHCHYKKENYNK